MQDLLKDVFSWGQDRVRSPFYTYITAAFIAINWRELAVLVWSDGAIAERIKIFDGSTSLATTVIAPILLGASLAVLSPYLKYGGALLAKFPRRRLDGLQSEEAQTRRIRDYELKTDEEVALAKLEEAREKRKIDEAKRTAEAKETGGDELVEDLEEIRKDLESKIPQPQKNESSSAQEYDASAVSERKLNVFATEVLRDIGKDSSGRTSIQELNDGYIIYFGTRKQPISDRKTYLNLVAAIKDLITKGYLSGDSSQAKMTQEGYKHLENTKTNA